MCLRCPSSPTPTRSIWASLSRAAVNAAKSRLRDLNLLGTSPSTSLRLEQCATCPMRRNYANQQYCGRPFLHQPSRDEATDGCGCPVNAKAADPNEHCPLTPRHQPANHLHPIKAGQVPFPPPPCDCKWCQAAHASQNPANVRMVQK